jgi:hypothetical protein
VEGVAQAAGSAALATVGAQWIDEASRLNPRFGESAWAGP